MRVALPRSGAFAAVAVGLGLFFVAAGAPTPLLPIYERAWGFPPVLLTFAFGAYALGLLVALLTVGSLSDHVGRRPVLLGALILELASIVLFLAARDVAVLIAARALQGLATGAATSAFSAAVLELAPPRRAGLGSAIGGLAPLLGLGIGALASGAVAQFSPAPAGTVWATLAVAVVLMTTVTLLVPETSTPKRGALASLVPQIAVPAGLRGAFVAAVPAQIAAWMTAALFLGLMPTILGTTFHAHSALENGATAFLEPAAAAAAVLLSGRIAPLLTMRAGAVGVLLGAAAVVTGVLSAVLPLIWIGGIVGGTGFGATFAAAIRSLAPRAHDHERAGLFAAIYVVAYLAFGVPAIIAGALVAPWGLTDVIVGYGAVIAVFALAGLLAHARAQPVMRRI
jgi:predicted MFS family arabinose efflux permease